MNTHRIVLISILSTVLIISKLTLSFIPNVHIITILLFLYTKNLGLKTTLLISFVFTTLNGLIWGFGSWIIMYFIIWSLYILIMHILMPYMVKTDYVAYLLATLGLLFGLLFSLESLFLYGFSSALAYYLRGLPYDLIHAVSNYIIVIVSYTTLDNLLNKLLKNYPSNNH